MQQPQEHTELVDGVYALTDSFRVEFIHFLNLDRRHPRVFLTFRFILSGSLCLSVKMLTADQM